MTFADRRGQRALETYACGIHRLDGFLRNAKLSVHAFHGRHVHRLPFDRHLGRLEDLLYASRDLLADTIARYQRHFSDIRARRRIREHSFEAIWQRFIE